MTESLFDLTGKFALITGATKGIGRAIAEAFVDHGATIAVTSRKAAIGVAADLHDRATLIAAYDAALEHLGRIDVLVCNAATVPSNYGAADETPLEEYSSLMESNIVNNAALMLHASKAMKARRDGVIVAVSSTGGINPTYGAMPYGVSKAGLNFFVKGLGGELAPYNVRVNAVAPGLTRSWSMEQSVKAHPEAMANFTKRVPLGRIIEPKEIAAGVILLATEGGKAMTGQIISMGAGDRGYGAPEIA